MLNDRQIRELFSLMAKSKPTASGNIKSIYLNRLGPNMLDYLLDLYPSEPKARIRRNYILSAIPYAKDDTRAVELARIALSDRAPTVRYWAIGLFASTLDPKYVAELQQHKLSIPKDADVVNKAVETINRKNASFFISSGHPAEGMATIQWVIDKPDTNRHSNKAKFKYDVEEFIERFSPEVVPDLQRILGPLYK